MPEISLPEVHLKDRLPDGLRDMTLDDIQKALPEVHFPSLDLGRETRRAGRSAERAASRAGKAASKAAKQADRSARGAQKALARETAKAARAAEKALPRRRGPNPVPIAIIFMIGGVVVGWLLASNPATGPRVSAWIDELRMRFDAWRGRGTDGDAWDTTDAQAYPASLRAPIATEPALGSLSESETGVGVGPGQLPEGLGTDDPTRVGAESQL